MISFKTTIIIIIIIHWEAHIVSKEQNNEKRKVKEAMTIHKLGRDKTLNQDRGIDLSKLWLDVIKPASI